MIDETKKAILVISSGTTNEKARKETIEAVEKKIAAEFSNYEIRKAFTSYKILNRLKDAGIYIDTPREALKKLACEGFEKVLIQPLHIIAGSEYKRILEESEELKNKFKCLIVSTPLLCEESNYKAVIEIFEQEFSALNESEAIVYMGHGGRGAGNESYAILQDFIDKNKLNIFVGTINSEPSIQSIIERLRYKNIKELTLMPFMIVAGNHALVDMASDNEASWKSILEKEGFKVNIHLHGLGEKEKYQNLYVQRLKDIIMQDIR